MKKHFNAINVCTISTTNYYTGYLGFKLKELVEIYIKIKPY